MTEKCIDVLFVEDNPGDVRLAKEALAESGAKSNLIVLPGGDQALDYLFRRGEYSGADLPDIIILDLNLPRKSGHEVLETIKKSSRLRFIPVVILTSSIVENDIFQTYDKYANCYIVKPTSLLEYMQVIKSVLRFWSVAAKLPRRNVYG